MGSFPTPEWKKPKPQPFLVRLTSQEIKEAMRKAEKSYRKAMAFVYSLGAGSDE